MQLFVLEETSKKKSTNTVYTCWNKACKQVTLFEEYSIYQDKIYRQKKIVLTSNQWSQIWHKDHDPGDNISSEP